jgi:hypothetical protein
MAQAWTAGNASPPSGVSLSLFLFSVALIVLTTLKQIVKLGEGKPDVNAGNSMGVEKELD